MLGSLLEHEFAASSCDGSKQTRIFCIDCLAFFKHVINRLWIKLSTAMHFNAISQLALRATHIAMITRSVILYEDDAG